MKYITFCKKCAAILIAFFLLLQMQMSYAAYAWYHGTVKRIYLNGNGFVLTMNSAALDDCKHKYVYYRVSVLGEKQVDRAYSMALAAQASGKTLGTVIDKAINGPGELCDSNGSMDIKD